MSDDHLSHHSHRTEEDLLGTMSVPGSAYYGVHTARAMGNFQISGTKISDVPEFVRGMVLVKKAAALANGRTGTLERDVSDAIIWACDQILLQDRYLDQFPIDIFQGGAGTSLNMNTNEVIANIALEHLGYEKGRYDIINPNDDVNKCQSTNDAYPTGLRLAVVESIGGLKTALQELVEALHAKGDEFASIITMGRTQLQDAVPISLGREFTAFGNNLDEELHVITDSVVDMLSVNLGATAVGTGVNTPDNYRDAVIKALREVTGLEVLSSTDLIEATSDTGDYVRLHSSLKRVAMKLSKMCNDLRLLSSGPRAGFNEINLPARQAGSSIMPAKVNPVIPEVVNQVAFKVFGNDVTLTMAAEAGQLQLNVMEPVIAQCLFESIQLLHSAAVTLRTLCIEGITANADVCKQYVENSIGIVTYLNPLIGHQKGDELGEEAARTGRSVRDLALENGLLTQEQIDEALSPENLMHPEYLGKLHSAQDIRFQ